MEWFKFYGKDFMVDPKINRLNPIHQLMWVKLLCHASDTKDGVVKYITEDDLTMDCRITASDDFVDYTIGFFDRLIEMDMIEVGENYVKVIHYQERQEIMLSNAERQKRYREKHKDSNVTESNDSNARVEKSREEKKRVDTTKRKKELQIIGEQEKTAYNFIQVWNTVHKRTLKAYKPIVKNLTYWLTQYSKEDIGRAILNIRLDKFWKYKMTPVILLRRRNPRGEDVDWIGHFLDADTNPENQEPLIKMVW